jgi:hypothetical protein
MTSWMARAAVLVACVAAGVASGWKIAEEFPVRFQGTVRVSVPYETTRGADPASLPMQETLERSTVEPTVDWLAAVVDRLKSLPAAIEPEGPFESEIDHLRRTLTVRIERQAGQDDYVIEHRSARVDATRGVLKVAGDTCLEAFLRLHERRMDERNAPLRKELEEWQAKVAATESEVATIRAEIAAMTPGEAGRETARERARLLSAATAEARKVRLEAENRFAGAREDITAGRPVETVLARLPEGPLRATLTKTIDGRDRLSELRELSRELESLSELYGPKHPRIARVKQRLADLAAINSSGTSAVSSASSSPSELLLATLEADWREKLATEQDLAEQLLADEEGLRGFDAAQARLAAAERSLGEARAKVGSVTARRDSETAQHADEAPKIVEGPTVADTPINWTMREWIAAGAACGAACGLVLLWGTRRQVERHAPEPSTAAPASAPVTTGPASHLLVARRMERLGRLRQLQSGGWSQPAPAR